MEIPDGMIPPPTVVVSRPRQGISELPHLGPAYDVITTIVNEVTAMPSVGLRGKTGHIPVQEALGDMLGVSQQSVSRYINGMSEPQLSDELWAALVRAYHDPGIVLAQIRQLPTVALPWSAAGSVVC